MKLLCGLHGTRFEWLTYTAQLCLSKDKFWLKNNVFILILRKKKKLGYRNSIPSCSHELRINACPTQWLQKEKFHQPEKWTSPACTWISDFRSGHGCNVTHRSPFKGQCTHQGVLSTCLLELWLYHIDCNDAQFHEHYLKTSARANWKSSKQICCVGTPPSNDKTEMLEKTNSIKDVSNDFAASDHIFDLKTSYRLTSNKSSTSTTITSNFSKIESVFWKTSA